MGTGYQPRAVVKTGMMLCESLAKVYGWRHRSRLVDAMAFGGYNRGMSQPRTDRDWLTKDEKIVDAYIADERCQFMFTLNAYYNMFLGLYKLTSPSYLKKMPKKLPVFFVAGADDPVGNYGKSVMKVYGEFKDLGMRDVKCRLYPGDRHEILNELDKDKVFEELYKWLSEHLESEEQTGGK